MSSALAEIIKSEGFAKKIILLQENHPFCCLCQRNGPFFFLLWLHWLVRLGFLSLSEEFNCKRRVEGSDPRDVCNITGEEYNA
jgi:hypothetical protein